MNQVYSEDTYWGLTVFHMAFPVALCAVFIFLVNPLFILLLIFDFKLAIRTHHLVFDRYSCSFTSIQKEYQICGLSCFNKPSY